MQNYIKITLFSFAFTTSCRVCCGDSSVLHCASPLRTISVSLARANENDRAHVHKEINFPEAKLESEINVPFRLINNKLCFQLPQNITWTDEKRA